MGQVARRRRCARRCTARSSTTTRQGTVVAFWIVGLEGDRHWPALARAVGHPEWLTDERFATLTARAVNAGELIGLLDEIFASRPLDEWAEAFGTEPELFWSPVNSIEDVIADEQVPGGQVRGSSPRRAEQHAHAGDARRLRRRAAAAPFPYPTSGSTPVRFWPSSTFPQTTSRHWWLRVSHVAETTRQASRARPSGERHRHRCRGPRQGPSRGRVGFRRRAAAGQVGCPRPPGPWPHRGR